jgi:hypothetical protein
MAIRFATGLYVLVALVVLVLAACSDDEDTAAPTSEPSAAATSTPSPSATSVAPCSGGLKIDAAAVAIVGRVLEISLPGFVEPGFEHSLVRVLVGQVAVVGDGDETPSAGDTVDVVLLADLNVEASVGDCVSLVGQEQMWACGPDCEDVGFVASVFEVLSEE